MGEKGKWIKREKNHLIKNSIAITRGKRELGEVRQGNE